MIAKNSPAPVETTRGEIIQTDGSTLPAFRVENLQAVQYGRCVATFDWKLDGVKILGCRLVADTNGRPEFVGLPRTRDAAGAYHPVVVVDRELTDQVFSAVVARLQADHATEGMA